MLKEILCFLVTSITELLKLEAYIKFYSPLNTKKIRYTYYLTRFHQFLSDNLPASLKRRTKPRFFAPQVRHQVPSKVIKQIKILVQIYFPFKLTQ
jgi:hypothetical protein